MQTSFQKQVQFSKYIKAGGRLREFNFLKLNNTANPSYNVDVSDERGRRFQFSLIYDGETWKINDEGLPPWIVESSNALFSAMDNHNE